jgi:hypothetical protein
MSFISDIGNAFSKAVDFVGDVAKVAAPLMFPGPVLAMTAANLAMDIGGQAINGAAKQLCQELGMPKFLMDLIGKVVDKVLDECRKPSNPECDRHCGNDRDVQDCKRNLIDELIKGIVDRVKEDIKQDGCEKGGGKGGKGGASSWLVALARALGEVAGDKAAKMVELTNKLTELNDAGKGLEKGSKEAEDNARESVATQSELSGVTKEFSQFMETISTSIKSIGDGNKAMAAR